MTMSGILHSDWRLWDLKEGTSWQSSATIESDTVGTPVPGVDIKISENGEVLYKSPGNFTGYFKLTFSGLYQLICFARF
jgi:hypothetical protein